MRPLKKLVWAILILTSLSVGTAYAIDVSGAFYQADVDIINLGTTLTNARSAEEISGASLIDDGFASTSFLNTVITKGTQLVNSMPPNNRILMEGAVGDDGGSFTEWTTEIRSTTELDVALLPLVPAVGDAFYVGCHNPCRILTFDIGQEGIIDGSWAIDWEYWDGTMFRAATNVDDRTNDFRLAGQRTVSWDMPTDFATSTITGSAVNAYWSRGVVVSVSGSATQQAIGNIGHYENGQYWMWVESLRINQQVKYQLSTGSTSNLVARHSIFPGAAGVVTPDDVTMELTDDFAIHFEGAISFAVTGSATQCLVCKGDALRLTVTGPNQITLSVSGSGSTTLVVSGIPEATQGISGAGHTIDVISDGTDLKLIVQGVSSAEGTAVDPADNTDSWEFATNNSATFFQQIYMLPENSNLGQYVLFDTEAEWDSGGVYVDMQSSTGAPVPSLVETYHINVGLIPQDDSINDGYWTVNNAGFFATGELSDIDVGHQGVTAGFANPFFLFENVQIEPGDRDDVTRAYIRMSAASNDTCTDIFVRIYAVAEDDPVAPVSAADAEGRTLTTAFTDWTLPSFVDFTQVDSPDITDVIDEVLSRGGWTAGNDILIFFITQAGSASSCEREIHTSQWRAPAARLKIERSTDDTEPTSPSNDFIELSNASPPQFWTSFTGTCNIGDDAGFGDLESIHFGDRVAELQSVDSCSQRFVASAGQTWSASIFFNAVMDVELHWLDSGFSEISLVGNFSCPQSGFAFWELCQANGHVAPANTVWVDVVFDGSGTLDAPMACVCISAPDFPDAANKFVLNPSFEQTYDPTGTWTNTVLSLTVEDVFASFISWDEFAYIPATTSIVLVETSIDGGTIFTAATNGGPIPLINVGDNVDGLTLQVRVTFTGDRTFSPGISALSVFVGAEPSLADTNVFYELRTTPGVLLTDLSPNGNDGVMSYPIQASGLISSMSPLKTTRTTLSQLGAAGIPDVASAVTGSATDNNLFGSDVGSFLPFGQLFSATASEAGIPVRFIWIIIIMILGIMMGGFALKIFKSTLMTAVILGMVLLIAAWVGDGIIPGWAVFVGIILLIGLTLLRPRLPI